MPYLPPKWIRSPWFFISIFALLGLGGTLNHAMWRDEMNVWLIARDSENFGALLDHIHYDRGHPALWHLLVALVHKIWDQPLAMQLLHWAIAVGTISVFWLYSPFQKWEKILFTFGYLPFLEFLLISRNYGIGLFFIFLFCATFHLRRKTYLIPSLCLVLMANTNLYGLLLANTLVLLLAVEWISDRALRVYYLSQAKPKIDLILSIILIIVGFLFALYMIFPPVLNRDVLTEEVQVQGLRRILVGLGRILGGYTFLIPNQKQLLDLILCSLLALGLMGLLSVKLRHQPLILGWYWLTNLQLLAVAYLSFPGRGSRHYGHFYLIFIAALWLAQTYTDRSDVNASKVNDWVSNRLHHIHNPNIEKSKFLPENSKLWKNVKQWSQSVWIAVLVIQFGGGIYGFYQDCRIPYSAAKATSEFIRSSHWDQEFIVGSRDINMAGISGYLDRPLYYPERQTFGSFSLPLKYDRQALNSFQVLEQTARLFEPQTEPKIKHKTGYSIEHSNPLSRILLILNTPLDPVSLSEIQTHLKTIEIRSIQDFTQSWIDSEEFYLYWVYPTQF